MFNDLKMDALLKQGGPGHHEDAPGPGLVRGVDVEGR